MSASQAQAFPAAPTAMDRSTGGGTAEPICASRYPGELGRRVGEVAGATDHYAEPNTCAIAGRPARRRFRDRAGLKSIFTEADVLSIHLVLSERSRGMVGASELATMKPTSILVNTSRGPIVDEAALVDALRRHVISCAAVDVYDIEPLPADHPLRSLDNALLTPHIGHVSQQHYSVFYRDAVEDIAAFIAGSPVRVIH